MIITLDDPKTELEKLMHEALSRLKENMLKGLPFYEAVEGREAERDTDWFITYMSNVTLNMLYLVCNHADAELFLKRASTLNRVLHDVTRQSIQEVTQELKDAPLLH